jgi:hypothetical protein
MPQRHTRLHPSAITPVGSVTVLTTNGATTLTAPAKTTGILLQGSWASGTAYAEANDGIYWSLTTVQTAASEGFTLDPDNEPLFLWWDTVQTPNIYLWLVDDATLKYMWFTATSTF